MANRDLGSSAQMANIVQAIKKTRKKLLRVYCVNCNSLTIFFKKKNLKLQIFFREKNVEIQGYRKIPAAPYGQYDNAHEFVARVLGGLVRLLTSIIG